MSCEYVMYIRYGLLGISIAALFVSVYFLGKMQGHIESSTEFMRILRGRR